LKITIVVPETLPLEQIKKIQDGSWHLDVSGFQLVKAVADEKDGTDEIVGQCENVQFHPVAAPPSEAGETVDPIVLAALQDFETWFWDNCKKELRTIREQALIIRKKLKLHNSVPEVPGVILGAIAAAAATTPKSKRGATLESVRPYLVESIKRLAVETQLIQLKTFLGKK